MDDFSKYKEVCVELLKTPTLGNLVRLKQLIDTSDSLDELQEYILFPLFIITSNYKIIRNENIITAVGECIQAVCIKSTIRVYKIFSDFLLQLLLVVHNINPAESETTTSEEVKLTATKAISALLKSASSDVLTELLEEKNSPLLGHLTFTMLKVAANEELKDLRLSALDCLNELSCNPTSTLPASMTGLFPGICTQLLKTIDGAVKQSHLVTQDAVAVLFKFIMVVLSNSRFEDPAKYDTEWLNKTRGNLQLVLEKIVKNPESHWRVKLEMTNMIAQVVEECSFTLEPMLPMLIRKLVQFTADTNLEVEKTAKEKVESLSYSHTNFDSAVRQNLYDIVSSLPRIMTQGITRDQMLILQELQGHLTLLGPRLEQSLIFSGLHQRLFKGLLISATVESPKVIERDEQYQLRYLRDDCVVGAFAACCSAIGRHGNDAVDHLLDVLRQKDSFYKESAYVMKYVVRGAELDLAVLSTVVKEYSGSLSLLEENNDDVILGHLILQVIGEASKRMGSNFAPLLFTTLKPVLEKAGHPNFSIVGIETLESIANSLQLASVSQMLEQNADYFAPQLSFQLRNILRYPRAVDLLRAVLLLSDMQMDQWLERMVQQALKGLDKSHEQRALPYALVLELYCKAAHKRQPAKLANPLAKSEAISDDLLKRRIDEFRANSKASEAFNEQEDENMSDVAPEEMEDEVEKEPPQQVKLIADILDRCAQLLPQSNDERLYSTLIQTICLSVEILSSHEDVFLPKVHQLWEPLRYQLISPSHLKQRQALDIFISLVRLCPDFIRQRAVTEALPKLVAFLRMQSGASRGRSSKAQLASQSYKFQKATISAMATLIEFLDPPVVDVIKIVQTLALYLSHFQVLELQGLAKKSLSVVARYHSGTVWLTLHSMVARKTLVQPNLPHIIVGRDEEICEYQVNAEELARELFPLSKAKT